MAAKTREGAVSVRWRNGARAILALLLASGILLTAACTARGTSEADGSRSSSGAQAQEVTRFAIVTPEKEADHGWNQQGILAAQEAAARLGIEVDIHSDIGYDNTETHLSQVAESGVDLIIAHASGFNTAGVRVAQQSNVPVLVVDIEQNLPGKVATAIPLPEQGGYLAGIAAAMKTQTNTVGIVASAENLNWFLLAGGFVQGVQSVNPEIEIVIAYIGPAAYADAAGGASITRQVIAAGADVIMGMGDGATLGYLQAIETAERDYPISYIATIGDVSDIATNPETVLTSVLWNFSDTYVQAITDLGAGTFGTRSYQLNVENGGIQLQKRQGLTAPMQAAIDEAIAGIVAGELVVQRSEDKAAVQALINARGA